MPKEKLNTFSFNNFKPFGEKMQTFPKKPITLIYGPNSIGKSSLLQSVLYFEYLNKLTPAERCQPLSIDIGTTNFAGDELDFGGFYGCVHKNLDRIINYEYAINNEHDLEAFFPPTYKRIKELNKKGVFEYIENLNNAKSADIVEIIYNRFKNFTLNDDSYFITTAIKQLLNTTSDAEVIEEYQENFLKINNLEKTPESIKIFNECIQSPLTLEDIIKRKDDKEFDLLDLYLLFKIDILIFKGYAFDVTDENILDIEICEIILNISLYKTILEIKNISIATYVNHDDIGEKVIMKNALYMNDEKVLDVEYECGVFRFEYVLAEVSSKNKFIIECLDHLNFGQFKKKLLNNTDENIDVKLSISMFAKSFNVHKLQNYDYLLDRLTVIAAMDSKYKKIDEYFISYLIYKAFFKTVKEMQYIGPLRYLPSRHEYYSMAKKFSNKNQKSKIKKIQVLMNPATINISCK